jgi:hypothetical protein
MQSGSYFTNLMSNDSTDPGEYGGTQSQNMEMPTYEGVVQYDNIPPSDVPLATEKVHAAAKEKRRSKNFRVEEDKLLVSSWLNVLQDPIHGVDPGIGVEFISTFMQTRILILIALKYLS